MSWGSKILLIIFIGQFFKCTTFFLRCFAHLTEWKISLNCAFFFDSDLTENHISLSKGGILE